MKATSQILRYGALAIVLAALVAVTAGCERQEVAVEKKTLATSEVTYPADYRSWAHVKSMAILEGHEHYKAFGGLHHVYANETALASLKRKKPFKKGSVLVFDLRETFTDNNAVTEGRCMVIGVMEKDPDRFPATEGWGFEDFKFTDGGPERQVTDARTQCMSCHESQKASDFVYSAYRK
jgi:hypothetical protein